MTDCSGDFCCTQLFSLIFTGVSKESAGFDIDRTNNLKVYYENMFDKIFQKYPSTDDIKLDIETYEDIKLEDVYEIPTNRDKFYQSLERWG